MHNPTLAVLVVFMAHQGLCQEPNPTCRSVKSQTLQPQFPHLYMGKLMAPTCWPTVKNEVKAREAVHTVPALSQGLERVSHCHHHC